MSSLSVFLWILLGIEAILFIPSGVLIFLKRNQRIFRVRSPTLVQISHWCNLFETLIVIYALEVDKSDFHSDWVNKLATISHFFTHYLFFIPFILRSYRLYLIFDLDKNWDDTQILKTRMKKTKEKWLLKLLAFISSPFILILILSYAVHPLQFIIVNGSNADDSGAELPAHIISIFLIFVEQLLSIISVYGIRNIQDDFKMTKELLIVNLTWIITSPNNIFGDYSTYAYQILIRNNIVFIVSSLYPLYKTYKVVFFEVPLTEEVLNSTYLILINKLTLDAFEDFLRKNEIEFQHRPGIEYLELWIKCEYLMHNPSKSVTLPELASTFNVPLANTLAIQEHAFSILDKFFYPLFKVSVQFIHCLKEVNKQNLYNTRINKASMGALYSGHNN